MVATQISIVRGDASDEPSLSSFNTSLIGRLYDSRHKATSAVGWMAVQPINFRGIGYLQVRSIAAFFVCWSMNSENTCSGIKSPARLIR